MALTRGTDIKELNPAQVRELQNLLLRAGYDPGPLDGVWGPKSKAAYQRFLTSNGYGSGVDDESGWVIQPMAQMSTDEGNVWSTIVMGGDRSAAPTATTPAATPAPPMAGTPAGTPVQAAASPIPVATVAATEETVRTKYPHLAYLLDNPEVKDVLLRATQGGWDQPTLQGELWKTSWWQTSSNATRLWDQKFAQDNATAMLEWDQRTVTVGNLVTQMGFNLPDPDIQWIAGRVIREGWSDEQLRRYLGQMARQSGLGPGQVTEQAAQFKSLGKAYMSTMSDAQATEYAIRVSEGTLTREGVESMLRTEAKGRFGWLSSQIDSGLSPMDLFGSIRNAAAQQLEVDPNQIDLSDPRWSELTNSVTDSGGNVRSMNYSEVQQWARQRPEWRFTQNANETSANLERDLLKTFGFIKGS